MLRSVLQRDRAVVIVGIAALILLSWAYTLSGAGMGMSAFDMTAMTPLPGEPAMPMRAPVWSVPYALLMLAMWSVMMVAMMLPSAAPMLLVFDRVQRQQQPGKTALATWLFLSGYLLVWTLFSVAATAAQWLLATNDLISPMLTANSPVLGGVLLVAAGLYQLTPLKRACLSQCRGTAAFITGHWQPGNVGAFRMGLQHGAFCLGCCWMLMLLLFVGGVMNLYWIAGLAVVVLAEKTLPGTGWFGAILGVALVAVGLLLIFNAG